MQNPLPLLALIASLAPLSVAAQNSGPPSYSFGMFPNMFGNNGFTVPQSYMNNGQSPFLTMPAPQNPYASPRTANTAPAARATPMAQPIPFWMQTPASPQGRARYITEVPRSAAPRSGTPAYTVFSPRNLMPMAPPRWAPLHGQSPAVQAPRPANNWATFSNGSTAPAPAVPATPPKWPTP